MKKLAIILIIIFFAATPASAMDLTAPEAPESAQKYFPEDTESFADGLFYILRTAIFSLKPEIKEAVTVCSGIIATVILGSFAGAFNEKNRQITNLVTVLVISGLLLRSTDALIQLGIRTVEEIAEYGKLLLPVMTTALAAQGGVSTSTALFSLTSFVLNAISVIATRLIVPIIYIYIALFICTAIVNSSALKNFQNFARWVITWTLKLSAYIFTGFISITRAISGTVDASALKATKLTIAGVVPVIGNVISDASETVLLSAGMLKNTAGVYGMLTILSVVIGPFLQIGVQYLILKLTGGICSMFSGEGMVEVVHNFTSAMGYILALLGTVCILLLISTVCFMKGIS